MLPGASFMGRLGRGPQGCPESTESVADFFKKSIIFKNLHTDLQWMTIHRFLCPAVLDGGMILNQGLAEDLGHYCWGEKG
jgi:hypothetical protein